VSWKKRNWKQAIRSSKSTCGFQFDVTCVSHIVCTHLYCYIRYLPMCNT
jgi:hypothetical protein